MKEYKVIIELKSDACFSSGESINGLVNNELVLDKNGFPCFLGKTFKGVLRESIKNILFPSLTDSEKKEIVKILGRNPYDNFQAKGKKHFSGKVKFSNFKLDRKIVKKINNYKSKYLEKVIRNNENKESSFYKKKSAAYNENVVNEIFSNINYSTRINEKGVSEDASLRAIRTLKKGLIFTSIIEVEDDVNIDLLKRALKTVKHIGSNKTRGKGLIDIEIKEKIYSNKNMKDIENDYIFYELLLKEPVKISRNDAKYNYEEGKKYIPKTTLKGAFISKILPKLDLSNEKSVSNLVKNLKFYNGYPMLKNQYGLPKPEIFYVNKNDLYENPSDVYYRNEIENIEKGKKYLFMNYFERLEKEEYYSEKIYDKKLKSGDFFYRKKDKLTFFDVDMEENLHHSTQLKNENIFRYQAISRNQRFYTFLNLKNINNDLKLKIKEIFSSLQNLSIGGSRNSGYGRVSIENIEGYDSIDDIYQKIGVEDNTSSSSNYSYCFSNVDIKDEILSDNSFIKKEFETSYNSYLSARTPMKEVIKRGSIINSKSDNIFDNETIIKNFDLKNINVIEKYNRDKKDLDLCIDDLELKHYISSNKRIKIEIENEYIINRIDYAIDNWLYNFMDNDKYEESFGKIESEIQNVLGDNFKTKANNLIGLLEKNIYRNHILKINSKEENDEIQKLIKKYTSNSQNRKQIINNTNFLNINLVYDASIQDFLNCNLSKIKKLNKDNISSKSYYGLTLDLGEKINDLDKEMSYSLKEKHRNYICKKFLKEILSYILEFVD
ncbi:MAG: RAMP superfamily CRISPR-associated protein [Bacillota bacterium]